MIEAILTVTCGVLLADIIKVFVDKFVDLIKAIVK